MRTRAAIVSILASAAVLIGGWELGNAGVATTPTGTTAGTAAGSAPAPAPAAGATTTAPPSGTGSTPAPSAGTPSAPAAPVKTADGTYTGASESTQYGDVQVSITVSAGKISDVTAVHLTDQGGRSVSISNRAAPILRQEVIAAQSAKVQGVSGATYTTDGYLSSVQSAIDQAGL